MDSFFSSNGAPNPSHLIFAFCFAFSFFIARFSLDHFLFQRLAIRLLGKGAAPLKFNKATQTKLVKCSESMWKLTYYAAVEACILRFAYREPWFRDTNEYFRGWPNQELKLSLKFYYTCQCGFYLYSIVALVTWETRRKDFAVMMSHHVITVFLIGYSYVTR